MTATFHPHVRDARLFSAHVRDARLFSAHVRDARLFSAHVRDARLFSAHVRDARLFSAHVRDGGMPAPGVGGVMVAIGRVPMLTASGTPPAYSVRSVVTPWACGGGTVHPVVLNVGCEVLPAEPSHYVPGALRPEDERGYTIDTLRVTDALGVTRDVTVYFRADLVPGSQDLDVPIGTDGVAGLYAGGAVALTASGGTGPYTWDIVTNASGCTLTPEGAYLAGPLVGIDRVRVTDALGEIGLAQLEVVAGQLGADLTADPVAEPWRFYSYGFQCTPYAKLTASGGTAPYTFEVIDGQTGAAIEPGKNLRASAQLRDLDGNPLDLTGWTFAATIYSQRGAVLADDLVVTAAGSTIEVDLPAPDSLLLAPAVLRVTCETAGAAYLLGFRTITIEVLLVERPEET